MIKALHCTVQDTDCFAVCPPPFRIRFCRNDSMSRRGSITSLKTHSSSTSPLQNTPQQKPTPFASLPLDHATCLRLSHTLPFLSSPLWLLSISSIPPLLLMRPLYCPDALLSLKSHSLPRAFIQQRANQAQCERRGSEKSTFPAIFRGL